MKKERDTIGTLLKEQILLSKQRTFYSQEMTFLALVRTVVLVMAFVIFLSQMVTPTKLYLFMLILFLVLLGLIVFVETLYKIHKNKEKLKTLEDRVDD